MGPIGALEALFQFLSRQTGHPLDEVRYVITMLLGYPIGFFFYHIVSPKHFSVSTRHAFSTAAGLFLGYVCLGGWQMLVLLGMIVSNYALLWLVSPTVVHRYTMMWAMAYMTAGNIYRMINYYGVNALDFSGPMMVHVTKVTYVAFALHDGLGRKESDLSSDQKEQRLLVRPSPLQYFSYTFNFHNFFVGPTCSLKEHLGFMDGSYQRQPSDSKLKSVSYPVFAIISKLVYACIFIVILTICGSYYTVDDLLDPDKMGSFPSMPITAFFAGTLIRLRFYIVWLLAESINNTAGMGFNGYNKDGNAKWDLMTNIRVLDIELAQNMRGGINAFNATCGRWLRRVCYDRAPFNPTLATLVLSGLWHGLYPSYYLMMVFVALSIVAARKMRKAVRPHFLSNRNLKLTYDIITLVTTRVAFDFMMLIKNFLVLDKALLYWSYSYYIPAIIVFSVAVLLPDVKRKEKTSDVRITDSTDPETISPGKHTKLG